MIDIYKFVTATAWVQVEDYFPFIIGPDATGAKLGVVRLGGHLEPGEKPWDCACREVKEEARLAITLVHPPCTYSKDSQGNVKKVNWDHEENGPAPIVFSKTGMAFLATSPDQPIPDNEAHGLLLLTREDIHRLCSKSFTLDAFLNEDGRAIFNPNLPTIDRQMEIDPKGPRAFKQILDLHPDLNFK